MHFFIHIPKTGGTSLRLAAIDAYGANRVVGDYGAKSHETSGSVRQHIYEGSGDLWAWRQQVAAADALVLTGHVGVNKYVSVMGASNTYCFVRDPLERAYSEYRHFVRHHSWTQSFREFAQREVMRNRQDKMLRGVKIEMLGGLGLTERFSENLALFNSASGLNMGELTLNTDPEATAATDQLSADDIAAFESRNKADRNLYDKACWLVGQELSLFQCEQPVAKCMLQEASPKKVAGWAWWAGDRDDPVNVQIRVNGEVRTEVLAKDFRPGLCRFSPPRGGHVGFTAHLACHAGDRVDCCVVETGQHFPQYSATVDDA